MVQTPPIIKNRTWRYLLRDFAEANAKVRSVPSQVLSALMLPAASVAWWLVKFAPADLLTRNEITLLLPGASKIECADSGRWLSFVPWLIGKPQLKVNIIMVGDELSSDEEKGYSSLHLSREQLVRDWKTGFAAAVSAQPEAEIFNGTLAQWHKGKGASVTVDACVMFSPGFSSHYETWLTEEDLLPLLRKQVPIGIFCYTKIDGLEDLHFLPLLGLDIAPQELAQNPFRLEDELADALGSFAQFCWTLQCRNVPAVLDLNNSAAQDFKELQEYAQHDFETFGADHALERLGARWEVSGREHGDKDAIIVLPHQHGILESTREIGCFDEDGFSLLDTPLAISEDQLASRPDDSCLIDRIMWALRLHRDWIAPRLEGGVPSDHDSVASAAGIDFEDFNETLRALIKDATGEDVDPEEFLAQMRSEGGVHGPTHPSWFDLLDSLNWTLDDYLDDPERFEPAFWTQASRRGLRFPVICESYAFFPDDKTDQLALDALIEVASTYPQGALLVFKAMPYQEVEGHKYHFGGMLLWEKTWHPFAFNEHIASVDDIIDQVESGFNFGLARPEYADDNCRITVPFNRMCYGLDPNKNVPMLGMTQGKWVTLMPGD